MKIRLEMTNKYMIEDETYLTNFDEYIREKIRIYGKFIKIQNKYYNSDLIVSIEIIDENKDDLDFDLI